MYFGRNALKILLADSSFAKGAFWFVRSRAPSEYEKTSEFATPKCPLFERGWQRASADGGLPYYSGGASADGGLPYSSGAQALTGDCRIPAAAQAPTGDCLTPAAASGNTPPPAGTHFFLPRYASAMAGSLSSPAAGPPALMRPCSST